MSSVYIHARILENLGNMSYTLVLIGFCIVVMIVFSNIHTPLPCYG